MINKMLNINLTDSGENKIEIYSSVDGATGSVYIDLSSYIVDTWGKKNKKGYHVRFSLDSNALDGLINRLTEIRNFIEPEAIPPNPTIQDILNGGNHGYTTL